MNWTSAAIVLSARRLGEGQAIASVLSQDHGRYRGVVPGGGSAKKRNLLQQGTCVIATWRARTAEQLGTLACEPQRAVGPRIIYSKLRLGILAAACSLIDASLPEREPNPGIYQSTRALIERLDADAGCLSAYHEWEIFLLARLGYGFDREPGAASRDALAASLRRLQATIFAVKRQDVPFARLRLAHLSQMVPETDAAWRSPEPFG